MEYKLKGNYEPRSLEEVVGELNVNGTREEKKIGHQPRPTEYMIRNALGLAVGLIVGLGDEILDQKIFKNHFYNSFFDSAFTTGSVFLFGKIKYFRSFEIDTGLSSFFVGHIVGQYAVKLFK